MQQVYIVTYVETPGMYKIGFASNLESRLQALEVGSPFRIVVVHTILTEHGHRLEQQLHKQYAAKRVKKEWFSLDDNEIREIRSMGDKNENAEVIPEIHSNAVCPRNSRYSPVSEQAKLIFKKLGNGADKYFQQHPCVGDRMPMSELEIATLAGFTELTLDELIYIQGWLEG